MTISPRRPSRLVALAAGAAIALGSIATPLTAFAATPAPEASATPAPTVSPAASPEPTASAPAVDAPPAVDVAPPAAAVPPAPVAAGRSSFTATGGGAPVAQNTLRGGATTSTMTPFVAGEPTASTAGIPYVGSLSVSPNPVTNYDLFAGGITVTATGLGASQRVTITDTSPSGEVFTFMPATTDATGAVTTTVRRDDTSEPEVGLHRIEATTDDGSMAGTMLEVTLSERLNAQAALSRETLSADEFHDNPVVLTGSGFLPNEWVTIHYETPDGNMGLVAMDQMADADGNVRFVIQADSASSTPGYWRFVILGMRSTRNGDASMLVTPSPDDREVGTISMGAAELTASAFSDPGVTFEATDLPPFGLYDVVLRDAKNRDYAIGRYRANGDGRFTGSVVANNPSFGSYRLSLTNADTNDFVRAGFVVTADDGSLPPAPTVSLAPTTIDAATLLSEGIVLSATGYVPGEVVRVEVRDHFRRLMRPSWDSIMAKQADETGAVTFTVRADKAPAAGEWEVAAGGVLGGSLIQRATLTVTGGEVATETPTTEEPTGQPTDGTDAGTPAPATTIDQTATMSSLTGLPETRSYFVRTTGSGGLAAVDVPDAPRLRAFQPEARAAQVAERLEPIVEAAQAADDEAAVLYEAVWTVPGVALQMNAATAAALTERTDVVSVTPIVAKSLVEPVDTGAATPANATSDTLTGARETWTTGSKLTGEGTTVAVIDTGVDYTHTAFGGPGADGMLWARAGSTYPTEMPPAGEYYDDSVILPGRDFAGADYNASPGSGFFPVPVPDDNPIDGPGGGHGTHVAATVAGRGVLADGTTFTGDYTQLTDADIAAMRIGPGAAPGAQIIPLKIFGDFGGSTDLAGAALDWVGGQIAMGRSIDVVNMSIGSNYGSVDDPENDLVQALSDRGVVVVIASGNSGDVTDVGGSPGSSPAALTVAASTSGAALLDGVEVVAPETSAGVVGAQFSIERSPGQVIDVTAPVVAPSSANVLGCTPYSDADKARVAGKIVWLEWDEERLAQGLECGSADRFSQASDAGAAGVLLTSTLSRFEGGIAGYEGMPGAQLTAESTAALRAAMTAGTLVVRIADEYDDVINDYDPSVADTIAGFSSRGVHGSIDDVIKPDLTAPGVNVLSAKSGTGSQRTSMSGTSMATPHTAGIAALTVQAHPDWSAERIKTVLMNTATNDVTDGEGTSVSVLRQGTGRVDAVQATRAQVTVASKENAELVSASFGVVEVADAGFSETRTLVLTSTDTRERTYTIGYDERTATPGASFSVSADTVTVPAGGTAEVTVTLSVPDPAALRRTVDPGQNQSTQTHIADLSGVVTFTPAAADAADEAAVPLWLPVFAAPKPVSTLAATDVVFDGLDDATAPLTLSGSALDQGEGDQAYTSRESVFVSGITSPAVDAEGRPAEHSIRGVDVLRAGAASTSPAQQQPSQGMLSIGVQFAGPTVGIGVTSYALVSVDANRDGRDDFVMVPSLGGDGSVSIVTYDAGTGLTLDQQPLNSLTEFDNRYDNDTLVVSTTLAKLGYTDTTAVTTMDYRVRTISQYAPAVEDGSRTVDVTPRASFDVFTPPVSFTTEDAAGRRAAPEITVNRGSQAAGELLVIAHDNASGARASVASWSTNAPVTATGVAVTTMPTKTRYAIDEAFDGAGLVVEAVYSDGSRRELTTAEYTLSGFDSATAGARVLTVSAEVDGMPFTTTFQVTVDAAGVTPPATGGGTDGGSGSGSGSGGGSSAGAADAASAVKKAPAAEGLATTGQDSGAVAPWAVLALVMTGLGAGAVLIARRRTSKV